MAVGERPGDPGAFPPEAGEAWWADVKAAFPDAESRASRTIVRRKQSSRFDADAAPVLLRLGVPAASGLYLKPPPVTEVLTTNLLPVMSMPSTVHLAPAAVTSYAEAREILAKQRGPAPGWMLRDGLVMSFTSLREPPLRDLCAGDPEEHLTAEWAGSEDHDTQHRFTDLLARTVERAYPGPALARLTSSRALQGIVRPEAAQGRETAGDTRADRVRPALRQVRSGTGRATTIMRL